MGLPVINADGWSIYNMLPVFKGVQKVIVWDQSLTRRICDYLLLYKTSIPLLFPSLDISYQFISLSIYSDTPKNKIPTNKSKFIEPWYYPSNIQ